MAETDRIVERRAMSADHEGHLAQLAQWIRDGDPATSPEAAGVLDAAAEYIAAQTSRTEELEGALRDAWAQIDYLHGKFQKTGSGEATLTRIDAILAKDQGNG